MAGVPEEVQELEPCTVFGRLRHVDFLQAVPDIDLPHGLEAFVPCVGEVAEQGVLFGIVAGQGLLDEGLVVSDDGAREQRLLNACLTQCYHIVQLAFAGLLLDLLAFLLAADNVQHTVGDKAGHFHDCKQVEGVPYFKVNLE